MNYAYDNRETTKDHEVGAGGIADYLKQENGKIFAKILGTVPAQNQFTEQDVVGGMVSIRIGSNPRYLQVRISEWNKDTGARRLVDTYLIPVNAKE